MGCALGALLLSDCASLTPRQRLLKRMRGHPALTADYWRSREPMVSLCAATVGASPDLIQLLHWDNDYNGFTERPRSVDLNPSQKLAWCRAIRSLPASLSERLEGRVAGVFWVEDLGGSGYTEYVRDSGGQIVSAFLFFDRKVLFSRTGDEWATWKESTPFISSSASRVGVQVQFQGRRLTPQEYALRFILVHELGHVLAGAENLLPRYSEMSWTKAEDRFVARSLEWESLRKELRFYQTPQIPAERTLETYQLLAKSSFPTLYAGTRYEDDFADSFALYVHTELLKDPYRIRVRQDGKVIWEAGACWQEPRCAAKREYFARLLKD